MKQEKLPLSDFLEPAQVQQPKGKRRINRLAARFASQTRYLTTSAKPICTAEQARGVVADWVSRHLPTFELQMGLPEVDDRFEAWRISLLTADSRPIGELMVRCADGKIIQATKPLIIQQRLFSSRREETVEPLGRQHDSSGTPSRMAPRIESSIVCGDAREVLCGLPAESVGLVITSPPYYNAKPEYSEYADYSEYLALLREVFEQCHRVLTEGRFLVVNASPVLIRRPSRNKSSKRIPVPFHVNSVLEEIGFQFLDDIIWVKPAGAGWNTGRGRRFAADRHPLQYKPVPVTEYFLVYRKQTARLIDWNIRTYPDPEVVQASRIDDGYEVTNVWCAKPAHHPEHPAVFPLEIVEKLVRYYSFKGDMVLDPFAGVGTVGKAALRSGRRLFLIDIEPKYCEVARRELDFRCQNS